MNDVMAFRKVLDIIKALSYLGMIGLIFVGLATGDWGGIGLGIAAAIGLWMIMNLFLGMGYCAVQVAINTDTKKKSEDHEKVLDSEKLSTVS